MRLYLDANAVIRATEGDDRIALQLRDILRRGGASIVVATSAITVSETLVGPLKTLNLDADDRNAERLVTIYSSMLENHTAVETTPIEISILFNAAKLRADHGSLKLPDAIHLASAIWVKAETLISEDRKLLAIARNYLTVCRLEVGDLDALLARIDAAP